MICSLMTGVFELSVQSVQWNRIQSESFERGFPVEIESGIN